MSRVTPRNEEDSPRPPPPDEEHEIPRGTEIPRGDSPRDFGAANFVYCPPRPPSLRETASADRAFLKEVLGDAGDGLARAEYGLTQIQELFKELRTLDLNEDAERAFVEIQRLVGETQKDLGVARGNFGVAGSSVSAAGARDETLIGVAEVASSFYESQLQRLGLEDDLKGYLPRGADLLDTHRLSVKLLEVELAGATDRIDDVVYEQMQSVADQYLQMGSARIYHNDAARQATCAAADCFRQCCEASSRARAAASCARAAFVKDTMASAANFARAANAASDAHRAEADAAQFREARALRQAERLRENGAKLQKELARHVVPACAIASGARAVPATLLPRSPQSDQATMCEIRTALNDLGKAEDPFERSGALEALAATLRREAPASVVMGAGTAELVATGGARAQATQIADLPEDAAEALLRRLESIARPHRRKEPLSPRRRHLLERNDLPIRGTLRAPPSVATQDFLEDLGLKADTIRTVRDPSELSPWRTRRTLGVEELF